MFWKKKNNEEISQLNSDEYEKVSKRITLLRIDFDLIENKLGLLQSNIRKLNLKVAIVSKEATKEEIQKDLKEEKLYL